MKKFALVLAIVITSLVVFSACEMEEKIQEDISVIEEKPVEIENHNTFHYDVEFVAEENIVSVTEDIVSIYDGYAHLPLVSMDMYVEARTARKLRTFHIGISGCDFLQEKSLILEINGYKYGEFYYSGKSIDYDNYIVIREGNEVPFTVDGGWSNMQVKLQGDSSYVGEVCEVVVTFIEFETINSQNALWYWSLGTEDSAFLIQKTKVAFIQ